MKPDDANGSKAPNDRPFRVFVIAGSNRRQYDCPGVDSKARTLMFRMADRLPQEWEIDLEDLGNVWNREQIRSCNACISTSAALCVWPCNCYKKGSWGQPDLMWNLDMYSRLDLADAWAIIGPINWYGPSGNLKAMFDRLVCMNGGNPRSDLIGHKDPERAIQLEHSPEWARLSRNHLEGRSAAFFCYRDGGSDELDETGRPRILEHPAWFDTEQEPFEDMREAYAPLVWQCRYSGIEVPDRLWLHVEMGRDRKYSDNQAEHMADEPELMHAFDKWTDSFAKHVARKGKVKAGEYRAYGHRTPFHLLESLKIKWRGLRMAVGRPIPDTSPAIQQDRNLNRDASIAYKTGEGAKLRTARWFWALVGILLAPHSLSAQRPASAGPAGVAVRYVEGTIHGFLRLSTAEGKHLADGDLLQVVRDSVIESTMVFAFADSSVFEERVTFTQRGTFRVLSFHLVQRGPAFAMDLDATLTRSGDYRVTATSHKDRKQKQYSGKLSLPPDVYNGMPIVIAKNLPAGVPTTVHLVAFTPKPRLIGLELSGTNAKPTMIGRRRERTVLFTLKPRLGALTGFFARLLGKMPPDSHVWIVTEGAPAFVRFEGPMYTGPVWRVELAAPDST